MRAIALRVAAGVVTVISVWATGWLMGYWRPCEAVPVSAACMDLIADNHLMLGSLALWALTLVLAVTAVAIRRSVVGILSLAITLLGVPLLHNGYFWDRWHTADTDPGSFVVSAALCALAAALIMVRAPRAQPGVPRDVPAEAVAV